MTSKFSMAMICCNTSIFSMTTILCNTPTWHLNSPWQWSVVTHQLSPWQWSVVQTSTSHQHSAKTLLMGYTSPRHQSIAMPWWTRHVSTSRVVQSIRDERASDAGVDALSRQPCGSHAEGSSWFLSSWHDPSRGRPVQTAGHPETTNTYISNLVHNWVPWMANEPNLYGLTFDPSETIHLDVFPKFYFILQNWLKVDPSETTHLDVFPKFYFILQNWLKVDPLETTHLDVFPKFNVGYGFLLVVGFVL